jgi:hypothetical protein
LLGSIFGLLAFVCFGSLLLASPAANLLFSNQFWLLIFLIPFLPFLIVLFLFVNTFYALSVLCGGAAFMGTGLHFTLNQSGIHMMSVSHRSLRLLAWTDIKEVRRIFNPPFNKLQAILYSGEIISIDLIDIDKLTKALEANNIPFIGKDQEVYEHEI